MDKRVYFVRCFNPYCAYDISSYRCGGLLAVRKVYQTVRGAKCAARAEIKAGRAGSCDIYSIPANCAGAREWVETIER